MNVSTYDRINDFRSPYLRQCSLALKAEPRNAAAFVDAQALNRIAKTHLPAILDFDASFVIDEAVTGTNIVTSWRPEPDPADFADADGFEAALEAHYPKFYDPKPWKRVGLDDGLAALLDGLLSWSPNNASYDETEDVEAQESDHRARVAELCREISALFDTDDVEAYESNHLLDILNEPSNPAAAFEGCFQDREIILLNRDHQLLLWIGHLRFYG